MKARDGFSSMSCQIPKALAIRLDTVTDKSRDPYAPSKTQIVIRGIELALKELSALRERGRP